MENDGNWQLKHPYIVMLLSVACVVLMAMHIPGVNLSNDYKAYFEEDFEPLVAYNKGQEEFTASDNIFISVHATEGDIFQADYLQTLEEMTEQSWQVPYAVRVDSLTNYRHTFADGDDLLTEALFEQSSTYSAEKIAERQKIALDHPLLANNLVSADAKTAAINIRLLLDTNRDVMQTIEAVSSAREMVKKYQGQQAKLEFRMAGELVLNTSFAETSAKDTINLFPVMFVVMLILLSLIYRNVFSVVSTAVVIVFSLAIALGTAGWAGVTLTPDGLSAFAMIIPIAVADCVHITSIYLTNLHAGIAKREALAASIKSNFKPVVLTTLTTILGFLSLNFSESPPIRMMGNTVAVGVLVAGILALTLLPALLYWFRTPKVREDNRFAFLQRLAEFVMVQKISPKMVFVAIAVSMLCVFGVTGNKLDQTIVNFFDDDIEFRQDVDWIGENLTGVIGLEVLLDSGAENGVVDVDYLATLEKFSTWMRDQDHVVSVQSFSDVVKQLNQSMNGDSAEYYSIPEDSALIAQYVLLYELSLPEGLGLTHQVNFEKSVSRIFVSLEKVNDEKVLEFSAALENWSNDNLREGMSASMVGSSLMFAHQLKSNLPSVLSGLILSLVLISALLCFVLKSAKLGILSLIPNLIPMGVAFGLWAIFVGEVGLTMSVVMGMTLGIVVDDTIHFMMKYQYARRTLGHSPEDSIRYVFRVVGPALVTTTTVLCVSFVLLGISSFQPNSDLGLMTSLIVAIALIVDMLILPMAILLWEKRDSQESENRISSSAT